MRKEIALKDSETSELNKDYIFEESEFSNLKDRQEVIATQVNTLINEKQKIKKTIIAIHKIISKLGYKVKQEDLKSKEYLSYVNSMIEGMNNS